MARPAAPWWWGARKRWACTLQGRRHLAPAEITERDTHAAWDWHRKLLVGEKPKPATKRIQLTVGQLFDAYVDVSAAAVAAGTRVASDHNSIKSGVKTICATEVDGKPFGSRRVASVVKADYESLVHAWRTLERFSPGYCKNLADRAKAMFAWGASQATPENGYPATDPFKSCKALSTPVVAPKYAGRKEAAAWLRFLRSGPKLVWGDYIALQRLLIHTGARPSEWTRATWSEIDFHAGVSPAGHAYGVLTRVKWKNAEKQRKTRRIIVTPRIRRMLMRRRPEDLNRRIVTTATGKPIIASTLSAYTWMFRDQVKDPKSGVPTSGPDRVVCYLWRHVAASTLIMQGVDIATVAELLGTSVLQISRTYAHLLTGHLASAADVLQRGGRRSEPSTPPPSRAVAPSPTESSSRPPTESNGPVGAADPAPTP